MPSAVGPDRKDQELLDNMWASDVDKGDLTKKDLAIVHIKIKHFTSTILTHKTVLPNILD